MHRRLREDAKRCLMRGAICATFDSPRCRISAQTGPSGEQLSPNRKTQAARARSQVHMRDDDDRPVSSARLAILASAIAE
jgi:hypothetical protein